MKLTKKAEYAIRAMIALGRTPDGLRTIAAIAKEEKIPKKFLEQILLALKAADLVTSRAGPNGGYRLAKLPTEISLGQILQAINEPLARGVERSSRRGTKDSPLDRVLADIRQCLAQRINQITLDELAAEGTTHEQVQELMWYI